MNRLKNVKFKQVEIVSFIDDLSWEQKDDVMSLDSL